VATGAACFTVCSMYGFGGTRYDASRLASNVASGVGFIGAGVITTTGGGGGSGGSIVHGLTTAAAIWLSAAVGVGCGVGMCVLSTTAALLTITVLRVGRVAQALQEKKEFRLQRLHELRRRRRKKNKKRIHHNNTPLKMLRRDIGKAIAPQFSKARYDDEDIDDQYRTRRKEQDSGDLLLEQEDIFVYHDDPPKSGYNETDVMDA